MRTVRTSGLGMTLGVIVVMALAVFGVGPLLFAVIHP